MIASDSDSCALAVKVAKLEQLLAEAAWRHQEERRARGWIRRANELVPNLHVHFTPPCSGRFAERPFCNENHAHGLRCWPPETVCPLCGKTVSEHLAAWAALE